MDHDTRGAPILQFLTWRIWLYTLYALGALLLVLTIAFWPDWGWDRRLIALTFLVLPFHVLEEWQCPGGFHVQYNLTFKTRRVDRYPMSRLTDSITNFAAMVIGFIFVALGGTPVAIGMMLFCGIEVIVHSLLGGHMYSLFRTAGKRSIYGPGSISSYLGFLPVAIGFGFWLATAGPSRGDWLAGIGVVASFLILVIVVPDRLKDKNSPYSFPSLGYFERFRSSAVLQGPSADA